jgi:hypothetical protein
MQTYELMLIMKLINASYTTKSTGLAFFVETNHENFLVMVKAKGTGTGFVSEHRWVFLFYFIKDFVKCMRIYSCEESLKMK